MFAARGGGGGRGGKALDDEESKWEVMDNYHNSNHGSQFK